MAKKKILTDNGQEILPITHESCVLDNNGVSIGSKIGNINELATDNKTDLVSAINDILYFNNETKDAKQQLVDVLIANGVFGSTSESWESLINKIQQIKPSGDESNEESGGEGGGSGSQYATGTHNYPAQTNMAANTVISYDLDFTPSVVVAVFNCIKYDSCNIYYMPVTNLCQAMIPAPGDSNAIKLQITDITNKSFTINNSGRTGYIYTDTKVTWYAFGAGSGGSSNGGGLDIISATELPATGKENQICVITDNPVDNYNIISSNEITDNTDTSTIILYNNIISQTPITTTFSNYSITYYISLVRQGSPNGLASYVYKNNEWVALTNSELYWLKDGVYLNNDYFGNLYTSGAGALSGESWKYTSSSGIYRTVCLSSGSTTISAFSNTKKIDFGKFNKVDIVLKNQPTSTGTLSVGYSSTTINNNNSSISTIASQTIAAGNGGTTSPLQTLTFDISSQTGNYYFAIYHNQSTGYSDSNQVIYIKDVKFY